MENTRKEVDLIELFTTLIRKIIKMKFLFAGIVIIFMLGAFFYVHKKKETYKTKLLVESFIPQDVCVKIFSGLNKANRRTHILSPHLLSLVAEKGSSKSQTFTLSLRVDDSTHFDDLIAKISQTFSNVPYVKEKLETRTKDLQSLIDIYENGIRENREKEQLLSKSDTPRTVFLNGAITGLEVRKKSLEQELQHLTSLKVVSTGAYYFENQKKSLVSFLKISLLGLFFAVFVVALKKTE